MNRWPIPVLFALSGCTRDGAPSDAMTPRATPLYACPVCAGDREAPLPDGRDTQRCVAVGASTGPSPADLAAWLGALPGPVRWVDASAAPGGDGSEARPFDTLERALVAGAVTLALRPGTHRVAGALTLRAATVIAGAGAGLTTVTAPAGVTAIGADAAVTLAGFTLVQGASTATGSPALDARAGAAVRVRDVAVRGAWVGLRAMGVGTTLDAQGLTVESSRDDALRVDDGAAAAVRSALLRDSGRYGVRAGVEVGGAPGRLFLSTSRVAGARGYGVALSGDASGDGGFGDCAADDPLARRGALDCLRDVAVQDVVGVGVGVYGARDVATSRILVACTRVDAATSAGSGYGVYAARGASLSLDGALPAGEASLSRGSQVLGNARAGVVVETGASSARDTTLALRGAFVASNDGPGIILQRGAAATEISYARVVDNAGLGLGLTEGTRVGEILCDQFTDTRPATLPTTVGPFAVGDGLSVYAASVTRADDNDLSRNGRFGALLGDATARLTGNRGADNLYGVGNYAPRSVSLDATNRVSGRATSPAVAPPITLGSM